MDELARARADKSGDSRDWSAADAAEEALSDIRALGDAKVRFIAHWAVEQPSGRWEIHHCVAGVTFPEHLALLDLARRNVVEDWIA